MTNLEYITQARKLLTEDYKTKHTNEYNRWLSNHQNSWMQPHVIVPFPPFIVSGALAPFKPSVSEPSEEAVVAKALELYNQFNPAPVGAVQSVVAETIVESVREPITSADVIVESVVEDLIVVEPAVEVPMVVEPVVEETIVESVIEELIVEPDVTEPVIVEPVVEKPLTTTDAIYKIFQEPVAAAPIDMPTPDPVPTTIEDALNIIPQPAEELAKVKSSGRVLPNVLQKIQDIKSKWI
jgi:hypothetical protein